MPPARVVGEERRPMLTAGRPRPGGQLPWREAPTSERVVGNGPAEAAGGTGIPVLYMLEHVARAIDAHARERAARDEEALGFLVGDWALDEHGVPYTVVLDSPTGPLEGSPVHVRFAPEGLAQVARQLAALDYDHVVVGWYHSHPGMGVFMSELDLRTQRAGFPHPHQVAMVIDPRAGEAAAFANGPGGPGTGRAPITVTRLWDRPAREKEKAWEKEKDREKDEEM